MVLAEDFEKNSKTHHVVVVLWIFIQQDGLLLVTNGVTTLVNGNWGYFTPKEVEYAESQRCNNGMVCSLPSVPKYIRKKAATQETSFTR